MSCLARCTVALALGLSPLAAADDPQWVAVATATTDRAAVLVGVGTYAADPGWNLRNNTADLEAMSKALAIAADIPAAYQWRIDGPQARPQPIQRAISEAVGRLQPGVPALLVVYWSGHAMTMEDQTQLFTHDTTPRGDGGYAETWKLGDLQKTVAQVVAAAKPKGVTAQVVYLNEVCRVEVHALPKAATLTPIDDWVVWATAPGDYSQASASEKEPSLFTGVLADQLTKYGARARPVALDAVVQAVAQDPRFTPARQTPSLQRPADPLAAAPVFVQPQQVRCVLSATDLLDAQPVADAVVTIDGQNLPIGTGLAMRLRTGKGVVMVFAAPGYVPRTITVDLTPDASGQRLAVPLLPQVKVIRGRLAGNRPIRITGPLPDLRDGLHVVALDKADSRGEFALILPAIIPPGLQVEVFGRQFPIPTEPTAWTAGDYRIAAVPTWWVNSGLAIAPDSAEPAAPATATPVPGLVTPAASPAQPPSLVALAPTTAAAPLLQAKYSPSTTAPFLVSSSAGTGRWPHTRIPSGSPGKVGEAVDLREAGTPVGEIPFRYDIGKRRGQIMDLRDLGAPVGSAPLRRDGLAGQRLGKIVDLRALGTPDGAEPLRVIAPLARRKQVLDLHGAGTPDGSEPLPIASPLKRRGEILDLRSMGTPDGSEPLASTSPVPRRETVLDLTSSGASTENFSISPALAEALAKAVRVP